MKVYLFSVICFLYETANIFGQCPSGAIGVSGTGCGCLSGCNLTAYGGPNCGSGVTGNCSSGEIAMSVSITVPIGCTYTVSATMANRASCSVSGADSGDQMKVDIISGSKGYQTGSSNATLIDSYTLNGPGTIVISGKANRADEIITYSTTSSGMYCVNCLSTLPIELMAFTAEVSGNSVKLSWETTSEKNNDYFLIERSADGENFEVIGLMNGAGNSTSPLFYTNFDGNPIEGISYYRLEQIDFDGNYNYSDIKSVYVEPNNKTSVIYPNPADGHVYFTLIPDSEVTITNLFGQKIDAELHSNGKFPVIQLTTIPEGIYFLSFKSKGKQIVQRINVIHKF